MLKVLEAVVELLNLISGLLFLLAAYYHSYRDRDSGKAMFWIGMLIVYTIRQTS